MAKKEGAEEKEQAQVTTAPTVSMPAHSLGFAIRQSLPKVRNSKTFAFTVADCHGYLIVGEYEDGRPGELFISVAKMGSTLSGLMDSFARSVSYGLQHGVPLKVYVKGMSSISFAPSGITDDSDIRTATSLVDYVFRRLAMSYLSFDDRLELGLASFEDMPVEQTSLSRRCGKRNRSCRSPHRSFANSKTSCSGERSVINQVKQRECDCANVL
jgi:ribonucleoside-diphosphate reductase alpha chain